MMASLRREVDRRGIDLAPPTSPSPLYPPDRVIRIVLGALKRPDAPEENQGFRTAFSFSERDPEDDTKRSSWAFGELRGRCSEYCDDICDISYNDDEGTLCADVSRDELFVDKEKFETELRVFYSTLLNHAKVTFVGPPRWKEDSLVEFDTVFTSSAYPTENPHRRSTVDISARCLLAKGGPLKDMWLIRGITLLGEVSTSSSTRGGPPTAHWDYL